MIKVFKFGGASIASIERAKNVAEIIKDFNQDNLIVVISAKGKTTNALELIVTKYFEGNKENAIKLFNELEQDHIHYAQELLGEENSELNSKLKELFTEIEWILNEPIQNTFDYYYDQIVCIGELLSTCILSFYFNKINLLSDWIDARDIIKTDNNYRDANVILELSEANAKKHFEKSLQEKRIIVTQGFIGSTDENNSVTLGREGSDYTAALLANMLNASSVTIWKDVPSLLNGDPKIFPNTVAIPEITFHEVIEMAFYGAQVIHPKTIKPLQNKDIPLYVKCFLDKSLPGTKIHNTKQKIHYPPIMVLKTNQILLEVSTRDYSFITKDNLSMIYNIFHDCRIKINLIQNAAISFLACVDYNLEKITKVLQLLESDYKVVQHENLYLFTVRHYTDEALNVELQNRTTLLTQKTPETIQLVVK